MGVVWFSSLDVLWRSVERLFPYILQLDGPWVKFLLMYSVDLARLNRVCLNRKSTRLPNSSSRNFRHSNSSRLWDLALWKGQKAGLGAAGVIWIWEMARVVEFSTGSFPFELSWTFFIIRFRMRRKCCNWQGLNTTRGLAAFVRLALTGAVWEIWGIFIRSAWNVTSFTKAGNDRNASSPLACCKFWTFLDHLLWNQLGSCNLGEYSKIFKCGMCSVAQLVKNITKLLHSFCITVQFWANLSAYPQTPCLEWLSVQNVFLIFFLASV